MATGEGAMSKSKELVYTNVYNVKNDFIASHEIVLDTSKSVSWQTFGKPPLNPLNSFNVFNKVGCPNNSIVF